MTDRIDTAAERAKLAGLTGFTPGPWQADGPREDRGWIQAPAGMGVVRVAIVDDSAGCRPIEDARLIAAAPDLLATVHRLLDALDAKDAEIERLREALARIANYRADAHAYDDDMGHLRRCFDVEAVIRMEAIARAALSGEGET